MASCKITLAAIPMAKTATTASVESVIDPTTIANGIVPMSSVGRRRSLRRAWVGDGDRGSAGEADEFRRVGMPFDLVLAGDLL